MHTGKEELKRARDDWRCRQGESVEFLGSKTKWSGDIHTDRFIYIAMVEEFTVRVIKN